MLEEMLPETKKNTKTDRIMLVRQAQECFPSSLSAYVNPGKTIENILQVQSIRELFIKVFTALVNLIDVFDEFAVTWNWNRGLRG